MATCYLCGGPCEMAVYGREPLMTKYDGDICVACAKAHPDLVCDCEDCSSTLHCGLLGKSRREWLLSWPGVDPSIRRRVEAGENL